MRVFRLLAPSALFLAACAFGQTYSPKTIRLEGADQVDQAEVLRLVNLPKGAPITKEQIEAAMQRLADSGLFSDMSYTVGPEALVITVTAVPGAGALPVRYGNFVWWQPGELEPLVEARVPLFHGKLPLTGQLTEQVEAALTGLLAQKGVEAARVGTHLSTVRAEGSGPGTAGIAAVVLSVVQPPVTLGEIALTGTAPTAASQVKTVVAHLASQEFDSLQTSLAIINNTANAHRDAGYLDVVVDPPVFSAPRKDMLGYAVDAAATVHPGAVYHVAAVHLEGAPAGLEDTIARNSGIKPNDVAGAMTLRIAEGLAARAMSDRGNLDAKASAEVTKDAAAHTVTYRFQLVPGPVYTFAGLDTSALSADLQHSLASSFHIQPGAIADAAVSTELFTILRSNHAPRVSITVQRDPRQHTAIYVLR